MGASDFVLSLQCVVSTPVAQVLKLLAEYQNKPLHPLPGHGCGIAQHGDWLEVLDLPSLNALTGEVILMTSKDAIKLPKDADARVWVVEIEVTLPPSLLDKVTATLAETGPES